MDLKDFIKSAGAAVMGCGVDCTPEMLASINKYSRTPLTSENVYIGKFIVAHSGIDRDNERFSPAILADFASTLPGKGYFNNEGGHPGSWSGQRGPGQGLWFDAKVTQMSLDEFQSMTGERPQLPPGDMMISALTGMMYALRTPGNEEMIAHMDGGIHRHVSIGFNAPSPVAVKNPGDNLTTLYYQYDGPGAALETSGVWLGAQPGAVSVKAAARLNTTGENNLTGDNNMDYKDAYENEKALREDTEKKHVDLVGKNQDTERALKALKEEIGDTPVPELKALAADGKAYRDGLVDDYVKAARMLGKCGDTPEAIEEYKGFVKAWPVKNLKAESEALGKEVAIKFPAGAQLPGEDPSTRRDGKSTRLEGGRDLSDPRHNEFIFGGR